MLVNGEGLVEMDDPVVWERRDFVDFLRRQKGMGSNADGGLPLQEKDSFL